MTHLLLLRAIDLLQDMLSLRIEELLYGAADGQPECGSLQNIKGSISFELFLSIMYVKSFHRSFSPFVSMSTVPV